jgi:hypothetical protein
MSTIPLPQPAAPADFSQQALALTLKVRDAVRTVDGFIFSPEGRRAEIALFATLPDEFLHPAAALLDLNPDLAATCGLTSTEVREAINFRRDFGNAALEVHLAGKGLEDTVAERVASVGERALKLHYYAKRTNLRDATENLVPHLDAMKRALGKGRKVKKELPVPAPVPATLRVPGGVK